VIIAHNTRIHYILHNRENERKELEKQHQMWSKYSLRKSRKWNRCDRL